jgi:hypothetical protein
MNSEDDTECFPFRFHCDFLAYAHTQAEDALGGTG